MGIISSKQHRMLLSASENQIVEEHQLDCIINTIKNDTNNNKTLVSSKNSTPKKITINIHLIKMEPINNLNTNQFSSDNSNMLNTQSISDAGTSSLSDQNFTRNIVNTNLNCKIDSDDQIINNKNLNIKNYKKKLFSNNISCDNFNNNNNNNKNNNNNNNNYASNINEIDNCSSSCTHNSNINNNTSNNNEFISKIDNNIDKNINNLNIIGNNVNNNETHYMPMTKGITANAGLVVDSADNVNNNLPSFYNKDNYKKNHTLQNKLQMSNFVEDSVAAGTDTTDGGSLGRMIDYTNKLTAMCDEPKNLASGVTNPSYFTRGATSSSSPVTPNKIQNGTTITSNFIYQSVPGNSMSGGGCLIRTDTHESDYVQPLAAPSSSSSSALPSSSELDLVTTNSVPSTNLSTLPSSNSSEIQLIQCSKLPPNALLFDDSTGNVVLLPRLSSDMYAIEDCDEIARRKRALEIEQGIEYIPSSIAKFPICSTSSPLKPNLLALTPLSSIPPPPRTVPDILGVTLPATGLLNPTAAATTTLSSILPTRHIHFCANGKTLRFSLKHPPFHSQEDFIHCLVPDLKKITSSSFYWGKMDRYEAEKLLEGKPEGTFLLRDSAQEEFLFSVSFRKYNRSLHARIEQFDHKFSFDCHDPGVYTANTVTELLEHYKDPSCVMFFEPALTIPLNRTFVFSLQQLCRATIVSHTTYDGINDLSLPISLTSYLKEYHYKQRVRVKKFEDYF